MEPTNWCPNEHNYHKLLTVSWLSALIVLGQSYSGMLISILTVPKMPIEVDSVTDLVWQEDLPWAIEGGSILEQIGKTAETGSTFRYGHMLYSESSRTFLSNL